MRQESSSIQSSTYFGAPIDVLDTQRVLRSELLDDQAIRYKPARDLAAHMLLNLDSLSGCWAIGTLWLRSELDCQRVDTGFGQFRAKHYYPGFAEAKNNDFDVPSFGHTAVDNNDPIMKAMWLGAKPVIFADMKQDRRVTPRLRRRLSGAKTKSKFGAALKTRDGSFGLICADWTEHHVPNRSELFDCFEQTVADVFSPIISAAKRISDSQIHAEEPACRERQTYVFASGLDVKLDALTASEIEVAKLVATGMSYKEIAQIRGRALSTIDHQLRSIREKMGVTSTSNLVSLLSRLDGFSS
ncbi:MAG: helix-turn-helix transcriptional regulator [Sulfitobacter sp.]|uniref:helix-turn-helix transcriptional regulator n=1 Tax=Celeribacter marinus TaxID=1397108 RepID=UPI00316B30E4